MTLGFCAEKPKVVYDMLELGDYGRKVVPATAGALALLASDYEAIPELLASIYITQGVSELLKRIVREQRPEGNDPHSFPSGHAAAAFSGATFIYRRYGPSLGIPAAALATLVAASRVVGRRHYVHDVAAGAALAILVDRFVVRSPIKRAQVFADLHSEDNRYLFQLTIRY